MAGARLKDTLSQQQLRELGLRQRRLSISPRIVGNEAGGVVQEVADAYSWRVPRSVIPATKLRNVFFRRRVQLELQPSSRSFRP